MARWWSVSQVFEVRGMTQTALDWHIEGFYARYIDSKGRCRAMVKVASPELTAYSEAVAIPTRPHAMGEA